MKILRVTLLVLGGIFVLLLAVIGFLFLTNRTPTGTVTGLGDDAGAPAIGDSAFVPLISLYTDADVTAGNRVEILVDDEQTFGTLWRDLRAARRSITFQTYYGADGAVADSLSKVLRERAAAGVNVRFLYDGFGASGFSSEWLDGMRAAGVQAVAFRPLRWYSLHRAQDRSHARVVVIDGAIGYTGGFGIDDKWIQRPGEPAWRETNVRVTGPVVDALQVAFGEAWAESTNELVVGDLFLQPMSQADTGGARAGLVHAIPSLGNTPAARLLTLTVAGARESLYITNAYFIPDADLRAQLTTAARRGVDVRILVPNRNTDVQFTRWAARAEYGELLRSGVRIYEYLPTMMHAKTFVADGVWSSIGSINLDARSLAFNIETALVVHDSAVGAAMLRMFERDLAQATQIELTAFRERPWHEKLLERLGDFIGPLL